MTTPHHLRLALILPMLFAIASVMANAVTRHVGAGQTYATVTAAAADTEPGDTIMIHGGVYPGGEFIANLQGTAESWIVITNAEGEDVTFAGSTEAWHLTDVAYLYIRGIEFAGQSGNGVNIDDGGTYETPSHHVIVDECYFHDMNASGNNDMLKLSGLDNFAVTDSRFLNGAEGGSGIDMVGCHFGTFMNNEFRNMGSNAIQAKGGTQFIGIERNRFIDCGQRAVNLGGSTSLEFFRPIDAPFEAADMYVSANYFSGTLAPIAYVGSVRVAVFNNTIYRPERWVIRILQETVDESRFLPSGQNSFFNNIIIVDGNLSTTVNIGPDTAPETFYFGHNLWYNLDDPSWSGPELPTAEVNGLYNVDPLLVDAVNGDVHLRPGSPAIWAGQGHQEQWYDLYSMPFETTPSIGAAEMSDINSVRRESDAARMITMIGSTIVVTPSKGMHLTIDAYDLNGRHAGTIDEGWFDAGVGRRFDRGDVPAGGLIVVRSGDRIIESALAR